MALTFCRWHPSSSR